MAKAIFSYEGLKKIIQCLKEDKMKIICQKFSSEIEVDINSLYFLYDGIIIDYDLTFYELANINDKKRLEMNIDVNKNDYKVEISKINRDENIRCLENKLKQNIDTTPYNNFDIKLKQNSCVLKYQKKTIRSGVVLNDGRITIGSDEPSITIYNKITFELDLKIKEHSQGICCLKQLNTGILASCSMDCTIKLFSIKQKSYQVLQTINDHNHFVCSIIELNNKKLVSCSYDNSIIIYSRKDN